MTETIGRPTRLREPEEPRPHIPDYHFVKVIGRGAFGTVWLAEETMAGVYRAIKVLRPRRFRAEVAAPSGDVPSVDERLNPTDQSAEPAPGAESGLRASGPPPSSKGADPWACGAPAHARHGEAAAPIEAHEADSDARHEPREADGAARREPRVADGAAHRQPHGADNAAPQERRPSLVDRELDGIHAYQVLAKDHPHLIRILKTGLCKIAPVENSTVSLAAVRKPAPGSASGLSGSSLILDPSSSHTAVYYVMEIADHAGGAQPHHPMDYQPLSLATLLRQRGRLPITARTLVRGSLVRESLLAPSSSTSLARESLLAPSPSASLVRESFLAPPAFVGVLECATALLDAIEHLHRAGLQHRDVKPANCLFVNGVLKLADLGLTASDEADECVGTPGYLPPAPPGADAGQRHGPPDDLYALGKVMYELTTGLPAANFPEWPADLDPAADPLLPRLRELINELCHPAAEQRLSSLAKDGLRTIRQRLASIQCGPRMLHTTRRRAIAALTALAVVAACAGVGAIVSWQRLTDPYSGLLGDSASDGSDGTQQYVSGSFRYSLSREHRPGERKYTGPADRTAACFWDLQTKLGPAVDDDFNVHPEKTGDCLIVAGAYQIQDNVNPVTGDVRNPRGKFDQLFLVVGDGPDMNMHLLYHGQPGRPPGTRGRFVWRLPLRQLRIREGGVWSIRLVCMEALTPAQAEADFKKWADGMEYSAIPLGYVAAAPLAVAPTALSASQPNQ